jgi:hypothetical protein
MYLEWLAAVHGDVVTTDVLVFGISCPLTFMEVTRFRFTHTVVLFLPFLPNNPWLSDIHNNNNNNNKILDCSRLQSPTLLQQ